MTYAIRKTFHSLASGTRVELVDPHNEGFDAIATKRHGYVSVRMTVTRKFLEQKSTLANHVMHTNGVFDIEADNLVKLRDGTL